MAEAGADKLRAALNKIGENAALREQFIAACRMVERLPENAFTTTRANTTGPIVDALHEQAGIVRKELSNGIVFDFLYRSQIARDFVMSNPEKPDHVWEPQTTRLLLHLARGAANVIVGGAYFGDQAILLANTLRNSAGMLHAFEPDGDQAAMLAHNAQLNGLDNIRVNTAGLWSNTSARLRFVGADALASAVAFDEDEVTVAGEAMTFPTTTIDAYLAANGIEQVSLIMLDIEGAEFRALQGAQSQLALPSNTAPSLVFEVHRLHVDWSAGLHKTDLLRFLVSFGYTIYAVRDFQSNYDMAGRPIELIPSDSVYLEGPPHGFNMLAVKDSAIIANDTFKIVHGVSPKLLLHRDPALHHPTGDRLRVASDE